MPSQSSTDLDARRAEFNQAADFALSMLAQFVPRDQVIDELVEKFTITYPEAESMLHYVEQNDQTQLQARRLPLISILSACLIATGIVLGLVTLASGINLPLLLTAVALVVSGIVGLWGTLSRLVSSLLRRPG
jgi:hypothetical protein